MAPNDEPLSPEVHDPTKDAPQERLSPEEEAVSYFFPSPVFPQSTGLALGSPSYTTV